MFRSRGDYHMDHPKSAWEFLRQGEDQEALNLFREAFARQPDAGNIIRLGIGYLWTADYAAAWTHFRDAINTYRSPGDIFHGMAGVAKWCMDEPSSAVETWRRGFAAPYAVGASVVRLPLLLFAASVLRPTVFSKKEAEQILCERLESPLAENWPGPLAKFILGLLTEDTLKTFWVGNVGNRRRGIMPDYRWLTEFYKTLTELAGGSLELGKFRMLLSQMTDTSRSQWSEDRHFAHLLQCEEFFLARHEAALAGTPLANKN